MSASALEGDPSWERGAWMQTYTGRKFYPLSAQIDDVDPIDIAHALSMQCRYNGHVDRFYSVAEHCVLMAGTMPTPELALWALLHDAAETYVGDMVRPLKNHMPAYRSVEDRLLTVIARRYGLDPQMPDEVKDADNRILLTERRALLSATRHTWDPYIEALEPLEVTIAGWDPRLAETEYLIALDGLL